MFLKYICLNNNDDIQADEESHEESANSTNDKSKCRVNIYNFFIYFYLSIVICNNQIIKHAHIHINTYCR